MSDPQALLLLAYGGPSSLEDIPAFLNDVRAGRPSSPEFIAEVQSRYAQIGGSSPLLPISTRLAQKLSAAIGKPVYVGMRHWHPFIKDTLAHMARDGVRSFKAICLAPHYSHMSIGAYERAIHAGLEALGTTIEWEMVKQWHDHPLFIEALADNTTQALRDANMGDWSNTKILFTAHSLPERILQMQDPYVDQLQETCALLARRLDLPKHAYQLCFQSAAKTGEPWLEPQVETLTPKLAEQGISNLLVAPIGFIAEHVEVLYDLDIMLQSICDQHSIRLARPQMLNDSDALVEILSQT